MNIAFLAAALIAQTDAAQPAQGQQTQSGQQAQQGQVARIRPSPELVTAFQAWGSCLDAGVNAVPASETPEAAAPRVVTGCATQLENFTKTGELWITGLKLPAPQQTQLRDRLAAETTGVEQRVAARIRELRAPPRPAVQGR